MRKILFFTLSFFLCGVQTLAFSQENAPSTGVLVHNTLLITNREKPLEGHQIVSLGVGSPGACQIKKFAWNSDGPFSNRSEFFYYSGYLNHFGLGYTCAREEFLTDSPRMRAVIEYQLKDDGKEYLPAIPLKQMAVLHMEGNGIR